MGTVYIKTAAKGRRAGGGGIGGWMVGCVERNAHIRMADARQGKIS